MPEPERNHGVSWALTSRALQLVGSLCGTFPVLNQSRCDDALQDGCPAACRSTRSICNHGRTGYVQPRLSISEIGDFARRCHPGITAMLLLVGLCLPGVQPHPHLRYPARPVSASSSPTLLHVFTDCSPAWRVGEFLFASHTAQCGSPAFSRPACVRSRHHTATPARTPLPPLQHCPSP